MESTISEEFVATSPMESLPTEILQKILGDLPFNEKIRAERVCKRWKNISTKEVWKGVQKLHIKRGDGKRICISLEPNMRQSNESFLPERDLLYIKFDELKVIHSLVSRAGQNIEELIFETILPAESAENALSLIATYCHNIKIMRLDGIRNSDVEAFSRLLRMNKNMNTFGCNYVKNVIKTLPLKDWKSLYIWSWSNIDEFFGGYELLTLIRNSPSLKNLQVFYLTKPMLRALSNCDQLKTLSISDFFGSFVHTMNVTPLLSHLKVLEYTSFDEEMDADNELIDLLRYHCPNLEELTLYEEPIAKPFSLELENAVLALPKLKSLILDGRSITDESLSRLSKLKTFGLTRCDKHTHKGLLNMIENSEYLEELDIEGQITVSLLKKLVKNTRERRKILKIVIPSSYHKKALKICKNSKIHLIAKLNMSPYFS